jgi:hypothetical protein
MRRFLSKFALAEEGAVTVDWVVLCAAVIGVGMVVLTPIAFSADSSAVGIAEAIAGAEIGYE